MHRPSILPTLRRLRLALTITAASSLILLAPAIAQPVVTDGPAQTPPSPSWSGTDAQGKLLDSNALKGKVVLMMFWSTECPVCLEKMHEIRHNLTGWQGRPFTVIGLNDDLNRGDWLAYEAIVDKTLKDGASVRSVWLREVNGNLPAPERRARHQPKAWLIDAKGRVVTEYEGRIPADAWDDIAELVLQTPGK